MLAQQEILVVRNRLVDDLAQGDFVYGIIFFRMLAAGIVERLAGKAVGPFELRKKLPSKGRAVVFTQELHGGYGRFDLMNPLLNVFFILCALPVYDADFLQHGFFRKLKKAVIDLILRTGRRLHDFRNQTAPIQNKRRLKQGVQLLFPLAAGGGHSAEQDEKPAKKDEQYGVPAVSCKRQKEGEGQHTQRIEDKEGNAVFPVQLCLHMTYP